MLKGKNSKFSSWRRKVRSWTNSIILSTLWKLEPISKNWLFKNKRRRWNCFNNIHWILLTTWDSLPRNTTQHTPPKQGRQKENWSPIEGTKNVFRKLVASLSLNKSYKYCGTFPQSQSKQILIFQYICIYSKWLDLHNFKVFGCVVYVHVLKKTQNYFLSICYIFASYDMHRKAYIFFEIVMNKMIITKNVKVDEQAPCYPLLNNHCLLKESQKPKSRLK
jgi:hypothetical protein